MASPFFKEPWVGWVGLSIIIAGALGLFTNALVPPPPWLATLIGLGGFCALLYLVNLLWEVTRGLYVSAVSQIISIRLGRYPPHWAVLCLAAMVGIAGVLLSAWFALGSVILKAMQDLSVSVETSYVAAMLIGSAGFLLGIIGYPEGMPEE